MTVEVSVLGDKIVVKAPYDALFIEKLKKTFTESERTYNEAEKAWYINYTEENHELVKELVQEHFHNTEEKLAIFKCEYSAPSVNDMPLIKYTRDDDRKSKAWCFEVIAYKRMGSHGSRRNPHFSGIVLAKVLMNGNTKIEAAEYKVYPYSKKLQMTAVELVENAASLDDFEKICKTLDEQSKKLGGVEIVDREAVIVKGFLVLSSLPSKALLDKALPEEFRNKRIGTKFVKIVSGYFYNKLGSLSRKFYKYILEKHAIWAGFGYIVPAHRVTEFTRDVEELRKDYEEFEEQLRAFLEEGKIPEDVSDKAIIDPEYVKLVREYLKEHGVEEIKVPNIADRVKIRLIPFSVDMKVVEEYLEEKAVKNVQKEIEAVKQEMFENLKKQLEERMQTIFEKLKNYERIRMSKVALKKLKDDINYVIRTAEDLGVDVDRVDTLRKTLETIEEVESIEKGKVTPPKEAEGRLKALLKELES